MMCREHNGERPSKTEPKQWQYNPIRFNHLSNKKGTSPVDGSKQQSTNPSQNKQIWWCWKQKNDAAKRETNTTETKWNKRYSMWYARRNNTKKKQIARDVPQAQKPRGSQQPIKNRTSTNNGNETKQNKWHVVPRTQKPQNERYGTLCT